MRRPEASRETRDHGGKFRLSHTFRPVTAHKNSSSLGSPVPVRDKSRHREQPRRNDGTRRLWDLGEGGGTL